MKWWEILGIILLFGGLVQLIKWTLDSLGLNPSGEILTFLISVIFSTLIVIILIQIQQFNVIKKLEEKTGIKEEDGIMEKLVSLINNKKGMMIDPRVLFWILILILGYLFLKSLGIIN